MKVCYVDESGDAGNSPFFVMVGIHMDAQRSHKTTREFKQKFEEIRELFPDDLKELKSSKILYGKGGWRQVDPDERKRLFLEFCAWIAERRHDVFVSAISKTKHDDIDHTELPPFCRNRWQSAAMNIALQVQTINQSAKNNKGQTFLFYDDNQKELSNFCDLLWSAPEWVDPYFERGKKQEPFDQIIDTAFAIKSHHSGIVQVADIYAFIFRRFFEITEGGLKEQWDGELELITECLSALGDRLYYNATGLKNANKSDVSNWYRDVAPDTYIDLLRGKI